jgi:hypothetical protein
VRIPRGRLQPRAGRKLRGDVDEHRLEIVDRVAHGGGTVGLPRALEAQFRGIDEARDRRVRLRALRHVSGPLR